MPLISMQEHLNGKYWWKHTYFPLKASLFYIHASKNITLTMKYCIMWMLEHFYHITRSWSESVQPLHLGVISWSTHCICALYISFYVPYFSFIVFVNPVGFKKAWFCWGLDPARTYWSTYVLWGLTLIWVREAQAAEFGDRMKTWVCEHMKIYNLPALWSLNEKNPSCLEGCAHNG